VAVALAQLVFVVTTASAEEQATKKLSSPDKPSAADGVAPRPHVRAPRPAALAPRPDEALEPPAFGLPPSIDETGERASTENSVDPTSRPERAPPVALAPALSLEVPERPALMLPPRMESVIREEALLSPAAAAPTISEAPPSGVPNQAADRSPPPDVAQTSDEPPAEVDVLSLIRMEIKQRLPYFEGCARSARRRNGVEIRRMQATWAVAADGSIKSMKVDGIDDPELGACIVRMGSRPFTAHPGADLVIPTPIVFVR
jgi:hypothetical protein